jgi:hypothetical protein
MQLKLNTVYVDKANHKWRTTAPVPGIESYFVAQCLEKDGCAEGQYFGIFDMRTGKSKFTTNALVKEYIKPIEFYAVVDDNNEVLFASPLHKDAINHRNELIWDGYRIGPIRIVKLGVIED